MDFAENTCFRLADVYAAIAESDPKGNLVQGLAAAFPEVDSDEARIAIIHLFDDAIEEIAHLPGLPEQNVRDMLSSVRHFQGLALKGLAQNAVKEFVAASQAKNVIGTLRLVGNTVATSRIATTQKFDRQEFIGTTETMLEAVRASTLPEMQKAVVALKLSALLRIMHEREGASDDQIRRRLKGIFADLRDEFENVDGEQAEFLEKFRAWVASSMKGGAFALGLTSDVLTLAMIAGPVALAITNQNSEVKLIEGPGADGQINTKPTDEKTAND
ncbi:hypothetical protein [Pseudooceanicola atlanticus]|uniref:Uncharacterized protein n=1 Tax=Pseudooceanicola atlanticus TaxID=1461694 RepID=A0A0A0EJT1_9RHOB|nr:hypothetical protein [Pseudooceanicola atlanticus]KGM50644.1 hypothetical protein ATO9_03970 [Pseudooceanicola atlanticus]